MKIIQKTIVILLTILAFSCKSSSAVLIEKEISINQVKEDLLKIGITLKDEFKISENLVYENSEYQRTTLIISKIDKKQVELLCFPNNSGLVYLKDRSTFIYQILDNELTYTFNPWNNDNECGTK